MYCTIFVSHCCKLHENSEKIINENIDLWTAQISINIKEIKERPIKTLSQNTRLAKQQPC